MYNKIVSSNWIKTAFLLGVVGMMSYTTWHAIYTATNDPILAWLGLFLFDAGAWSSYPQAGYDLPLRTVRPENHFLALPSPYQDADAEAQRAQTRGASLQDSLDAYSEELAGTAQAKRASTSP